VELQHLTQLDPSLSPEFQRRQIKKLAIGSKLDLNVEHQVLIERLSNRKWVVRFLYPKGVSPRGFVVHWPYDFVRGPGDMAWESSVGGEAHWFVKMEDAVKDAFERVVHWDAVKRLRGGAFGDG